MNDVILHRRPIVENLASVMKVVGGILIDGHTSGSPWQFVGASFLPMTWMSG
jgi:hypothetical protein